MTCPKCEPDNPAARYADTCVTHRVQDSLPAHYFDCDRFQTYNYGTRSGTCDCTATADFEALLASNRSVMSAAALSTGGSDASRTPPTSQNAPSETRNNDG